jgi:hypothetical protein
MQEKAAHSTFLHGWRSSQGYKTETSLSVIIQVPFFFHKNNRLDLLLKLLLLQPESLRSSSKVFQAGLVGLDADAGHVISEPLVKVGSERVNDLLAADIAQEPGGAGKVVDIRHEQVEDAVQLGGGQAVDGGDVGDEGREAGDGLGVLEVERGPLHVYGALAGVAGRGELVALVLELAGLEGEQGEDGGGGVVVVNLVLQEAAKDPWGGLGGSAAFGVVGDARSSGGRGNRFHNLDGVVVADGLGAGDEAHGNDSESWHLHDEGVVVVVVEDVVNVNVYMVGKEDGSLLFR